MNFPRVAIQEARAQAGPAIICPERNCWRTPRAHRLAFLVDAAAYFAAFKAAALQARHSILIVGWNVDSRTYLEFPERAQPGVPNQLGPFLNHLVSRHESLQIRVLNWDSPLVYSLDREWMPQAPFDWFMQRRLRFALDNQHPFGASQHQKIVMIDDAVAFMGGIDLAADRLDDSEHYPFDESGGPRIGRAPVPTHDVQAVLDGPAARAIAEIAHDRWTRATGERLRPAPSSRACWPVGLHCDLAEIEVAIARTMPTWKDRKEVREVEAMFVDSIAAARQSIYIENQYFSSARVAQALLDRLAERDCPDIVMVLPNQPMGWLELAAMGCRQRHVLARIRAADEHGRFRAYVPVVGEDGAVFVKVHSKLMIVDDRFLHMGSANLNNRSMGLDSECNIAIESEPGADAAERIRALRDRLLAEHLGTTAQCVGERLASGASLIEVTEELRGPGRSLVPLPAHPPNLVDSVVAGVDFTDPATIFRPERVANEFIMDGRSRTELKGALVRLIALMAGLLLLGALWRWGPGSQYVSAADLAEWTSARSIHRLGIAIILAAYVVGGQLMFPIIVLITATGLLYGPVWGFLIAATGSITSATIGYGIGALLGRRTLHRLAGKRLAMLTRKLARRGVMSMTIIRLLPLAPFSFVNFAAGASHIRFRDFVLGTIFGMLPGITAITLFSGQLVQVLYSPDAVSIGLLAGLSALIGLTAFWSWRRFVWQPGETVDG